MPASPSWSNMKVVYDETPEQMMRGVEPLLEAGANISAPVAAARRSTSRISNQDGRISKIEGNAAPERTRT
jgi:ACT domain-containing protein